MFFEMTRMNILVFHDVAIFVSIINQMTKHYEIHNGVC